MVPSKIPEVDIERVLSYVQPFIAQHLDAHSSTPTKRPFILCLTGLQGSGKSTWTDALVTALQQNFNYNTINLSLDDLYLDHDELLNVRKGNPSNQLLQARGQPGTHDIALSLAFFESLKNTSGDTLIPSFDKSKFNGEGGRAPQESWRRVPVGTKVDVVVFEGWCVGFQPLTDEVIKERWNEASQDRTTKYPIQTLRDHTIEDLLHVNNNLRRYSEVFMGPQHSDYLIHLDTDDLVNVYEWRIQQEHALWQVKSQGMTDDEVVRFVKGYMPAYELYLDQLRHGFFRSHAGCEEKGQLSVILDRERNIVKMEKVSS
jgi:D-glycerate 3-kinase